MLELIVIDSVAAHTVEIGDVIKFHSGIMTVTAIDDGEDIMFSGLGEMGYEFDVAVDPWMILDILGYPVETDEDEDF